MRLGLLARALRPTHRSGRHPAQLAGCCPERLGLASIDCRGGSNRRRMCRNGETDRYSWECLHYGQVTCASEEKFRPILWNVMFKSEQIGAGDVPRSSSMAEYPLLQ